MANQPESASYDAGVYQLQTTDPVQGGAGGVANAPLLNLANRTAYLKQHLDAMENGTYVPSGVATLNSPTFTGDPKAPTPALGDSDTSISTTDFVQKTIAGLLTKSVAGGSNVSLSVIEAGNGIWLFNGALTANIAVIVPNTAKKFLVLNRTSGAYTLTVKTAAGSGVAVLQGKQQYLACDGTNVFQTTNDLSSIALDGTPTLVNTPAQFDNSQAIVNSSFVQRALGNLAGEVVLTAATTLTAAHTGKLIVFNSASALTHTLPAANSVLAGTQILIYCYGAGAQTIQRGGADSIGVPSSINSFIGTYGDTGMLESDGISQWRLIGGSLNIPNSGVITGPNFTTAAQFDNSNRLATTAFVRKASRQFSAQVTGASGRTLSATDFGTIQVINTITSALFLPPANVAYIGQSITVVNAVGGAAITLSVQGADTLNTGMVTTTAITLQSGDALECICTSGNTWIVYGTGALQKSNSYAVNFGVPGYQRLPSGLFLQWGSCPNSASVYGFAIAFPNYCLGIVGSESNASTASPTICAEFGTISPTSFTAWMKDGTANNLNGVSIRYIAWGY